MTDEFAADRRASPRQIQPRVGDGGIQLYRRQLGRRQRERVMLGVAAMDLRGVARARPSLIRWRVRHAVRQCERRGGTQGYERRLERQPEIAGAGGFVRRRLYRISPRRQPPDDSGAVSAAAVIVLGYRPARLRSVARAQKQIRVGLGGSQIRFHEGGGAQREGVVARESPAPRGGFAVARPPPGRAPFDHQRAERGVDGAVGLERYGKRERPAVAPARVKRSRLHRVGSRVERPPYERVFGAGIAGDRVVVSFDVRARRRRSAPQIHVRIHGIGREGEVHPLGGAQRERVEARVTPAPRGGRAARHPARSYVLCRGERPQIGRA